MWVMKAKYRFVLREWGLDPRQKQTFHHPGVYSVFEALCDLGQFGREVKQTLLISVPNHSD
jgi:hypothetical protein